MALADTQPTPVGGVPTRRPLAFIAWAAERFGQPHGPDRVVITVSQRELTLAWGVATSQGTTNWYIAQLRQWGVVLSTRPLVVDLAAMRTGPTVGPGEPGPTKPERPPPPGRPGGGGGEGGGLGPLLAEQARLVAELTATVAGLLDLQARVLESLTGAPPFPPAPTGPPADEGAGSANGVARSASGIAEAATVRESRIGQEVSERGFDGTEEHLTTSLLSAVREPHRESSVADHPRPVAEPAPTDPTATVAPLVDWCRRNGRPDHLDDRGRAVLGRLGPDRLAHGVARMRRDAAADARITTPLGLLVARATRDPAYFDPPPSAPVPRAPALPTSEAGWTAEVDAEVSALEDDPGRVDELAALDARIVAFLAGAVPAATARRLMATEEARRAQRRTWWAEQPPVPA